ncbi:hypothetical protein [Nonomuraea maheshkhaliensis]|uniref:hypothetical protein n=1 Tax=Nonomuraea maheshkhaliensis TaxID=419590 RepID=UPI0031F804CA
MRDPIVVGALTEPRDEAGHGTCGLYQPAGERVQLLRITLDTGGIRGQVDEYLKDGGKPLPAIVPDGYGAYIKDPEQETHIAAILVRGKARLLVGLGQGSTGRDSAGDMVAFLKLIAPKLLAVTGTPSSNPSQRRGTEPMPEMVPNPLREVLQDTLKTIEPLLHEMRNALDTPFKNFHTGKVWTGPVAKAFDGELDRHNGRVNLRWLITPTPAEVPEQQALEITRRYNL